MRERINRLAKGIIDMETPRMRIEPESLDGQSVSRGIEKKELYIASLNGLYIKGLLYSSNPRVKVASPSFGGLRNHVAYEVDSEFLDYGDAVEGSFYLVTNAGEREIPYRFRVKAGVSGETLGRLKEAGDFAEMARQDFETAVRVFEFRDFVDVPFMQDRHVRTLYDGLKGHGSRYSQVEQFLVALGLKKPVDLIIEERRREYENVERVTRDAVTLKRSGWGYLPVTASVDGAFIQTVRKNSAGPDFDGGTLEFPFRIHPGSLHAGRNFGRITFQTPSGSVSVEIRVTNSRYPRSSRPRAAAADPAGDGQERGPLPFLDRTSPGAVRFLRYLNLRLDLMSGHGDEEELKARLIRETEDLRAERGPSVELCLMEAEVCQMAGRRQEAGERLEECGPRIRENREMYPGLYCLHAWLSLQLWPNEEKLRSLGRLTRKYMEEGGSDYLLFHVFSLCEETYCAENPGEAMTRMKELYANGCRSPFLYERALKVLNEMPQLLYTLGSFEIQTLNCGAGRGEVGEELAVKAARLASISRQYQPLPCRVLKQLYERYPRREILEAVCGLMIRGQCRRETDFPWYEKALAEQVSLTRLYEYFLYSLPKDYGQLAPREVLLYFSYDNDLDRASRAVLYANVIRYMDPASQLYREYRKNMSAFAAEQILQNRIDGDLAVIYDAVIYPDMVDEPVARALPAILNSSRIRCEDPRMRSVAVCYEELTEEGVYPLEDGEAYVPIFFEGSCILFQDAYGNRYADVPYTQTPVLRKPELEKRCFDVYPEHPMLLLGACRKAEEKEEPDESDLRIIERGMERLRLHPLYKSRLAVQMMRFYQIQAERDPEGKQRPDAAPLLALEKVLLTGEQKADLCETLIGLDQIPEAYRLIRNYYCRIGADRLSRLCSRMILSRMFDRDDLLLTLAFSVFAEDRADSVILDYLCEHFNGLSEQMTRLLFRSVSERVETYDLAERLLAQMLFSGADGQIDQVFDLYAGGRRISESIVRAYYTKKCADYFLRGAAVREEVFRYLEDLVGSAAEKEKLSPIYLLALTRYDAERESLSPEQKELCRTSVDVLLASGMVFPHFRLLARHIRIPEDVEDKEILQYNSRKDARVELQVRILPREERFREEEMKRVYQGIFIRPEVLFDGEVLEYRIYERQGDERVLTEKGSLRRSGPEDDGAPVSRFRLLNRMAGCWNRKEEDGLRGTMEEYLRRTAAVEELFAPMES